MDRPVAAIEGAAGLFAESNPDYEKTWKNPLTT
jgi:hypothetical protein